jgi:hypothetical protein
LKRPFLFRAGVTVIFRHDLQGDSPPDFTPFRFARFALVAIFFLYAGHLEHASVLRSSIRIRTRASRKSARMAA